MVTPVDRSQLQRLIEVEEAQVVDVLPWPTTNPPGAALPHHSASFELHAATAINEYKRAA